MRVNQDDTIVNLEKQILAFLGVVNASSLQSRLIRKLILQISLSRQIVFDQRLTPQEQYCLFYAAHGYSAKQISQFLKCEPRTARYYRAEILRKLSCVNMTHAVFVGMQYGYLPIDEKNLSLLAK